MTLTAEAQAQITAFVLYSIPLVVALWKVFSLLKGIEDRLEDTIREVERKLIDLGYQSQIRSQQLESLNDKLVLAVNGTKELVSHVRSRTKIDTDRLHNRLDQIERFLVKTSDFESRE